MNFNRDKETYSKLIERCEKFFSGLKENGIYVKRYTHDGFDSTPGYDKRFTVYEVIEFEVSTGKQIIKKIAENIKENYVPFGARYYDKQTMKMAR